MSTWHSFVPAVLVALGAGGALYAHEQRLDRLGDAAAADRTMSATLDARVDAVERWRRGREGGRPLTVRPVTAALGESGFEACARAGLVCVGVLPSRGFELASDRYWGWYAFDCHSRVKAERCDAEHPWIATRSELERDPGSKVHRRQSRDMCLTTPELEGVLCADAASLAETPPLAAPLSPAVDLSLVSGRSRARP